MGYLYPEVNKADNRGEYFMYEALRDLLPSGFICYHNRKVGTGKTTSMISRINYLVYIY